MVSALVPRCQGPLHPMAKESCSTSYFWKLSLGLLLCLNLGLTCSATEQGSQLPAFALCPHWAAQQLPWRKGNSTYKHVRLQQWHGLTSFNHLRLSKTAKEFRATHKTRVLWFKPGDTTALGVLPFRLCWARFFKGDQLPSKHLNSKFTTKNVTAPKNCQYAFQRAQSADCFCKSHWQKSPPKNTD